jgi:hypothetical protein
MLSRAAKQTLVWGGVLILVGMLLLVHRFVELSPWVWAAFVAGAGLGACGLYLADRSDGLVLLAAYVLWAIAGLIGLVPPGFLRDEGVACYVLLAIALPFLAIFSRDRARWRALVPAYPLLVVSGAIGLAQSGHVGDDLVSAFVVLATAIPFFVIYARDRRQWWALIPGLVLAAIGLSLGSWLPWHAVRAALIAGDAVEVAGALVLLVAGAWILVRATAGRDPAGRDPAGKAARSGGGTSEPRAV